MPVLIRFPDESGRPLRRRRNDTEPRRCPISSPSPVKSQAIGGSHQIWLGPEFFDRRLQPGQIGGIRHHHDVGVAAQFRSAAQHARPAAHQQRPHAIPPDRRKDSENRARGQANLPVRDTSATVSTIPPAVGPGSADTTPPIRLPRACACRSWAVSRRTFTPHWPAGEKVPGSRRERGWRSGKPPDFNPKAAARSARYRPLRESRLRCPSLPRGDRRPTGASP